jgi:uncharacterized protein YlxW (UPF0749 family)
MNNDTQQTLQDKEQVRQELATNIRNLYGRLNDAFRERDNKRINALACRIDVLEMLLAKLDESIKQDESTNV